LDNNEKEKENENEKYIEKLNNKKLNNDVENNNIDKLGSNRGKDIKDSPKNKYRDSSSSEASRYSRNDYRGKNRNYRGMNQRYNERYRNRKEDNYK